MAKMGKFDNSEIVGTFKKLQKSIEGQQLLMEMTKTLDDIGEVAIGEVKSRTPVDSGGLRNAWDKTPAQLKGNGIQVTITNNKEYAPFVEYGHRQEVGRYVPAIGKRLKAPFVKGQFMLKNSLPSIQRDMLEKAQTKFDAEINKLLGGK